MMGKHNKTPGLHLEDFSEGSANHAEDAASHERTEKRILRKQDIRIIPLCSFIFLLCYLDRANIGNAKALFAGTPYNFLAETNMSQYQYTIALVVFLVAYAVFEVPSNWALKRLRPSRWIALLMVLWGSITMAVGATNSYASVAVTRTLLGAAEAGLFPGLVYYLTFWYKSSERSLRVAIIYASAILSGAFGGALAYGIGYMQGVGGLSAWRWVFILEGIPSVVCAALVLWVFPDFPETASWLTEEEKRVVAQRLETEGSHSSDSNFNWSTAKVTLTDWRLYGHYTAYFAVVVAFSALALFSPSIVLNLGYRNLDAQLMTIPPYAVGYCITLTVAWSADHHNARALHAGCSAFVSAAGFLASALLPASAFKSRYGCLIVAATGTFATIPPLLGWLSANLHSTAAAGLAIALNISISIPGQILGVWIYTADEAPHGYPTGHWTNFGMLILCGLCCFGLRWYYIVVNRNLLSKAGDNEVPRLFAY